MPALELDLPKSSNWGSSAIPPALLFAAALLLTYGFVIFSFFLTIDEEFQLDISSMERAAWAVQEGRWAMSALAFFLPNPVAPMVSTGLGLAASGFAWWWLCRHSLGMRSWEAFFAAAFAGTIPVLAFIFSFDTVALSIGIGNLLLIGFMVGLESSRWPVRILGVLSAAAAVGIYDTFILAIVALALAYVLKRPKLSVAVIAVGTSAAAFLLARVIGIVAAWLIGASQTTYTSGYFDLAGLISHPGARFLKARTHFWETISLSEDRFGLSSPWLATVSCALVVVAAISIWLIHARTAEKVIRSGALVCLVLIPLGAELIAPSVPLRSMLYLPIIGLILCSATLPGMRAMRPRIRKITFAVFATLIILSVLGNASISNRLFASAATSYALDQHIAFKVSVEKDQLLNGATSAEMPAVIHGMYLQPHGPLTTPHESLGRSFFAWDSYRGIQFLRSQGVMVYYPTSQETQHADKSFQLMPSYPEPGWVKVEDGVLLVKFSDELRADRD